MISCRDLARFNIVARDVQVASPFVSEDVPEFFPEHVSNRECDIQEQFITGRASKSSCSRRPSAGTRSRVRSNSARPRTFNRRRAARRVRRSQPVGFLPDTHLGIVWRFEFARVGQGWRVPLMMARSFSMSAREGFWPESVWKTAGRCAASSVCLRMWWGMRPASTAANSKNLGQSSEPGLRPSCFAQVLVRTRSTTSHSLRPKSGTRWNASLPGAGHGARELRGERAARLYMTLPLTG